MTEELNPRTGRLERSVLVLPATDWHLLEKAAHSQADLVVVDLDDLVAPQHKLQARKSAIRALTDIDWRPNMVAFRMNALSTSYAYHDLVEVMLKSGKQIDLLLVPKVDHPNEVVFVDTLLSQIESELGLGRRVGLEIQIETASSMLKIGEIAFASLRTEALVFGPGDYAASMSFPLWADEPPKSDASSKSGPQWQYALQHIAVAAKAAGLRAIDGPFGDVINRDGFAQNCREASDMGYDGKWCLDFDQVSIANQIFLPTERQIQRAQEILTVYQEATVLDNTVVFLRGKLIDAASLRSAQNTLAKARLANLL